MRRRVPLGRARLPLEPYILLPLPEGIELEADASARLRFIEEDRRAEFEELNDLDMAWRSDLFDAGAE